MHKPKPGEPVPPLKRERNEEIERVHLPLYNTVHWGIDKIHLHEASVGMILRGFDTRRVFLRLRESRHSLRPTNEAYPHAVKLDFCTDDMDRITTAYLCVRLNRSERDIKAALKRLDRCDKRKGVKRAKADRRPAAKAHRLSARQSRGGTRLVGRKGARRS